MAACLSMAFVVLQWLQPTPPDKPIVVKGTVNRTRNNSCGWVIPYGGLQHLTPQQVEELANTRTATGSDGLADYVSSAESSAGFLKEAWDHMKAAGELEVTAAAPWHTSRFWHNVAFSSYIR
jgi:hypothetical protein